MRKRLLILLGLLNGLVFSQNSIVDQFSQALADVAEQANPAVVTITTEKVYKARDPYQGTPFEDFFNFHFNVPEQEFRGRALGSGVIVDARKGYILTNNHVINGADEIKVQLIDRRVIEAEIVGTDPKSDLAVLQIKAKNLTALKLGDSDKLRVGEWVLAIGSPFSQNLSHTVTAGIVSALGRSNIIPGANDYEDFIQTDAAINPGNSGGALLNARGDLVGINTAIATGGRERSNRGVGFAIPSNMARKVMDDLIDKGYVVRAWMGVYIQPVEDQMARALDLDTRNGAIISQVVEDSPADKGGIKSGDVIVEFDGVEIHNPSHLQNVVSSTEPGKKARVEVIRDGHTKKLTVVLEELPQDDDVMARRPTVNDDELGLEVQNVSRALAERFDLDRDIEGAVVTDVRRSSPAARAGIRPGDVIVRVDSHDVGSADEFYKLSKVSEKEAILLLVRRGEAARFYALELD